MDLRETLKKMGQYKATKIGLRGVKRHPILALAAGAGALWYRSRQKRKRQESARTAPAW